MYEVSGDQIITEQQPNQRKEISKFYFEPSGILVLDYQGGKPDLCGNLNLDVAFAINEDGYYRSLHT